MSELEHEKKKSGVRYGMVIDLDKCSGCMACAVACQQENNISFRPDESNKVRSLNWMEIYRLDNKKEYPDHVINYLPRPCMHCDSAHEPPCTFVCPVNATKRDEETGIVSHIYPRCIGCRYCIVACSYHARKFNWWDPTWPKPMESGLNPKVSVRMRGVVEKCSFCHHRLNDARAKAYHDKTPLKDVLYTPACVEACPTKAMTFGNLLDAGSEVARLAKDGKRAFRLLEKLHTEPKVIYLSDDPWVRELADKSLA
jgi:molybdopterin-containing oxidoreductase family iron-sulfur binding subunit